MNKKSFIIACGVLIIDQVIKSIMEVYFTLNSSVKIIKDFFYITVVHNTGGAWSILSDSSYILIILSIVVLILLLNFANSFKKNKRNNIAFGLLYGGILSNLADRIFLGYVRDYLDFYILGYNYPVFNIADIAIVVGVLLLIIAILKGEDKSGSKSSKR